MSRTTAVRTLAVCAALIAALLAVQEAAARGGGRGGGAGGGGFHRGGGGGRGAGAAYSGGGFPRGGYSGEVSRSSPARNGSIRSGGDPSQIPSRSGSYNPGSYSQTRPYGGGSGYEVNRPPAPIAPGGDTRSGVRAASDGGTINREPPPADGETRSSVREGPQGGTVEREVTREGDEVHRDVTVTGPNGETASYEGVSERTDNGIVSSGHLETSTGIDANTGTRIEKTDDGFVAHGGAVGDDGAVSGTLRKDGDTITRSGVATDGDEWVAGAARCKDGHCSGARVYGDVETYKYHNHYYYPYYHYWYACPVSASTYYSRYGTPVYSCANTVVISTTVVLDHSGSVTSSSSSGLQAASSKTSVTGASSLPSATSAADTSSKTDSKSLTGLTQSPVKAQVRSGAAIVYEAAEDVSVYATSWEPSGVYSEAHAGQHYWVGGETEISPDLRGWIDAAVEAREKPDANATVISYEISDRLVYLTSEPPVPGVFVQQEDDLYAWIPGVREPGVEDEAAIAAARAAQAGAGGEALEKEVRQLEKGHETPPSVADPAAS